MNSEKPKISVVICAYNAAHCIEGILYSLQKQTFKDFEIVVADDGSTDRTSEIAKAAGALVVNMTHQGLSAARNVGINNSRAEIVAIIDSDCYASPQWLEEIHKEITNGEIVVTGNTMIPKSNFLGDCISGLGYPGGAHLGFEKMWKVDENGYTNHLAGGNCAFIKKQIQDLGAFNETLTITADDVYLSMKILEKGFRIKYNPQIVMYHQPRKDLKSFVSWHYMRGRGSYFFKKHLSSMNTDFGQFYKLRLWSTKNMIKAYWKNPKILVMLPLLVLSFATQKVGYVMQFVEREIEINEKDT